VLVVGVTSRSSLATLKAKVLKGEERSMLQASDFADGAGVISLTVAKEGVQVPLPAFLQKASWMEIGAEQGVLIKAGFKYWMPQKDGFLFKDADDKQRTSCINSKVSVGGSRVEMSFRCEKLNHEDARFKSQPYPIGYRQGLSNMMPGLSGAGFGSGVGYGSGNLGMSGAGFGAGNLGMPGAGFGAGNLGGAGYGSGNLGMSGAGFGAGNLGGAGNNYVPVSSLASPYMNSKFSTFWMPVTNGSPYGWNDYNWGAFNYDYYAVTPMGYWGCPSLAASGTCSTNPYYYPFNP